MPDDKTPRGSASRDDPSREGAARTAAADKISELQGRGRSRRLWLWSSIAVPLLLVLASAGFVAHEVHDSRVAADALAQSRAGLDQIEQLRSALSNANQSFRPPPSGAASSAHDPIEAAQLARESLDNLDFYDVDKPLIAPDVGRLREAVAACLDLIDMRRIAFLLHDDDALAELVGHEREALRPALVALDEVEADLRWLSERRKHLQDHESDELRRSLLLSGFLAAVLQGWLWIVFRADRRERVRTEEELRQANEELKSNVAERTLDLAVVNRQLSALSSRFLHVQEQERHAVALELHDQVGQQLAALLLNLRVMESDYAEVNCAEAASRVHDCTEIVQTTYDQIHDLSLELRPSLLDQLGLVPTVEWYARHQQQRSECAISVSATRPPPRMSSEIETAAFRIVQEAVTNALKHAGATSIDIVVRRLADKFEISVRDDGNGFDLMGETCKEGCGLGLLGMRERARLAAGNVSIRSRPGAGTEVKATLPVVAMQQLSDPAD